MCNSLLPQSTAVKLCQEELASGLQLVPTLLWAVHFLPLVVALTTDSTVSADTPTPNPTVQPLDASIDRIQVVSRGVGLRTAADSDVALGGPLPARRDDAYNRLAGKR